MCHLRDGADDLLPELLQAEDFLHLIVGVGLDSCELGYPPSLFQEVFTRAEALGLKRVAHAGAPCALPAKTEPVLSKHLASALSHALKAVAHLGPSCALGVFTHCGQAQGHLQVRRVLLSTSGRRSSTWMCTVWTMV